MSLKLLKQSLDFVEEDSTKKSKPVKKGKQSKLSSVGKNKHFANNVREHQPQNKNSLQDIRSELKTKSKKSEENIKRLLALSMNTIKVKDAEKIVQRAHKGRYVKKIIPKVEQESIFTDEDFRKFEEEYFNS